MGALNLIHELRRKGYEIRVDGDFLEIFPAYNISPEFVRQLKQSKRELLAELQRENRRGKVIATLQADSTLNRVYSVDSECDPDQVIVTIAVRGVATYELAIPRAKHDPWQFLRLYEKLGGQSVH